MGWLGAWLIAVGLAVAVGEYRADSQVNPSVMRKSGEIEINSGGLLEINSGGDVNVKSGGAVTYEVGSANVRAISSLTQDATLTAAQSGGTFILSATGKTVNLPATAAGVHYKIFIAAAALHTATNVYSSLSPVAADKLMGLGFTSADDKDARLAGDVDREGDFIAVVGDGSLGWYIENATGSWVRE
jgi:hypothetical protein